MIGIVAVSADERRDDPTVLVPDEQLFTASEDGQIKVWTRSSLPLRTDNTGAATQVRLPKQVQAQVLGDDESFSAANDGTNSKGLTAIFGVEKNPAGIHNPSRIPISFDADRAQASELEKQANVVFVAASIDGAEERDIPTNFVDAVTLLADVDGANENVTFRLLAENVTLSAGEYSFSSDFNPGSHIIYAIVPENESGGFHVDSVGDASIDGEIVVIGVTGVTVQQGTASIHEPPSPRSGDTLEFRINTTAAFRSDTDGEVIHTVALYQKRVFENSRVDIVTDQSELGPDFNVSEDSQIEHSIENTTGVADVEEGTTINGIDLTDGRIERGIGVATIIDLFAEELRTDTPVKDPIVEGGRNNSRTEDINAAVRADSGRNRDTTIAVDTSNKFTPGTYQYIVYSRLDNNATAFSTATGTINLTGAPAIRLNHQQIIFKNNTAPADVANSETRTLKITNTGTKALLIDSATITGADADQFSIVSQPDTNPIPPGENATVTIKFVATQRTTANATLTFDTNASTGVQKITLSKTGTNTPTPTPQDDSKGAQGPGFGLITGIVAVLWLGARLQ